MPHRVKFVELEPCFRALRSHESRSGAVGTRLGSRDQAWRISSGRRRDDAGVRL